MAPRVTKPRNKKADSKDVAELKELDAVKKLKGKAKIDLETIAQEAILEKENISIPEQKKNKRGKKAQESNGDTVPNGNSEETAPPAKKSRKKVVPEPLVSTNEDSDESNKDSALKENGHEEKSGANGPEEAVSVKGRKKVTKKVNVEKKQTASSDKKADNKDNDDNTSKSDDKAKSGGKSRGRKAKLENVTPESNSENNDIQSEVPPKVKVTKAKIEAAQNKTVNVKDLKEEASIEETVDESKKKDSKVRKGVGKKALAKETPNEEKNKINEVLSENKSKAKKAVTESGDANDEAFVSNVVETKPTKAKKGQKKSAEIVEKPQSAGEATKRRRKLTDDNVESEVPKKLPLKNKSTTKYDEIDFSNKSINAKGKDWNFKISCWNVDGIRAWLNKGGLDYVKYEKPDILCLQEIKCSKEKLPNEVANLPGYHAYWLSGDKDGYAGVGLYTTKLAMNVQYGLQNEELDSEGRIITAEYEQFYLICTYVPNAGKKLITLPKRLKWNEEFRKYVSNLDKKKPVIICGDMNVAHNEIDLSNPKSNRKNAGFTEEERTGMTELLGDGFVDSYRHLYPDKTNAYTFWTYMMNCRAKNVGWRLDYFLLSQKLLPSLCDNMIRNEVYGSDHCPITLFLHLSSADKPKE